MTSTEGVSTEIVASRYGNIEIPADVDLIGDFLRRYGEWAYIEIEFLSDIVPHGCAIFDVGAFVGTFSLGALHWKPRSIVAVEPNPTVFGILNENLKSNCSIPYQTAQVVVGTAEQKSAVGKYMHRDNLGSLSFSILGDCEENRADSESVSVGTETLSSLRTRLGDYDFLKLDAEGGECDALESDRQWITANHPIIWVECNEDKRSLVMLNFLLSAGYSVHYFAFPCFNPRNFNNNHEEYYPIAYEAGLLALPSDRSVGLSPNLVGLECILKPIHAEEMLRQQLWLTPRWGKPDWTALSKPQLIAVHARLYRGEKYGAFLK